jgi:hypothetical protein
MLFVNFGKRSAKLGSENRDLRNGATPRLTIRQANDFYKAAIIYTILG